MTKLKKSKTKLHFRVVKITKQKNEKWQASQKKRLTAKIITHTNQKRDSTKKEAHGESIHQTTQIQKHDTKKEPTSPWTHPPNRSNQTSLAPSPNLFNALVSRWFNVLCPRRPSWEIKIDQIHNVFCTNMSTAIAGAVSPLPLAVEAICIWLLLTVPSNFTGRRNKPPNPPDILFFYLL